MRRFAALILLLVLTVAGIAAPASARLKKAPAAGAFVPEYTHFDSQGSAVAATNAAGTITWRERVRAAAAAFSACNRSTGAIAAPCGAPAPKPFGEELLNPAANADNTGYTGHLKDDATGLNYMQARYYDPIIGRFLSTDPIGYQDQLNLYAYVANDPVNATDPTGMCTGSRITNDDGTCASTGGFNTGTSGAAHGMQIDRSVGQAVVRASGETATASETRAAGQAFRASYNGRKQRFGYGSRAEVRGAAAGELIRLTERTENERGTGTYSLGPDYGYADPVTSGSPDYVDMDISLPYGATFLDSIHSHPGALEQGPITGRGDAALAGGGNNYVVGSNRQLCLITEAGYRQCSGI